ncbi:MAG: large-conductance mechanosensitive channel protein MscL [Bacilli bacterium]|nr:large-conductance mechanosensitive channel protein MscL [Bacilli bacterium]
MIQEFKKFISRGNVVDLAVGVVVGGAFSKIVTSLVDNIIMPLVGIIIGGIDFTKLSFTIFDVKVEYGLFIQNVVDFLIIAFCIFMVVKLINKVTHKKKEEPKPPVKSDEVKLLEEIRDLMKKEKKETKKIN